MNRSSSRGKKYTIPDNFVSIVETLKLEGRFSRNSLVQFYNVSPSVVDKWLEHHDIALFISNKPKEMLIDLKAFIEKTTSGLYSRNEICKLFDLNKGAVNNIIKRNDIAAKYSTDFNVSNRQEFVKCLLEFGKQETARRYETTLAIVTCWCKKNNIELPKYYGLKRNDLQDNITKICSLHKAGHSLNFIGTVFNTSGHRIRAVLERNGHEVITVFNRWESSKNLVRDNIGQYVQENRDGLNLKELSLKHQCSYEQLKEIFKESGIEVALHSYNKSRGELELKEFVASLGFNPQSMKRTFDGKTYEIDCLVSDKNFGIEYCGEFWHSFNQQNNRMYHYQKFEWARNQNITLMTIFEHEWYNKRQLIESMIKVRMGIVDRVIYGRKTQISVITKSEACLFHDTNHIHGGLKTSSIDIGLYYEGKLVSVGSFGKSRFSKDVEYEILRFSSDQNTIIVGGFSKIFKYFLYVENPNSVVSYCDLRFGQGRVYEKSGFVKLETTSPNYWYYYKNDGRFGKFESRMKYQKHKLKDLENYSDDKTEYEIMSENGFLKIYDCGNYKFVYRKK